MKLDSNWPEVPIGSVASVRVSTVDKKEYHGETPVRLVNYTDVYYNELILPGDYMSATATPEQIRRFSVRAGDVAITKDSETSDDIGIPAYAPGSLPGHVWGYHLAVYRARDPRYARFLKWFFEATDTKAELAKRTPGVTRVGLGQNTLQYLRLRRPEPELAQSIASFLDHETGEIDAFIADQEQLIALLSERREAVVEGLLRQHAGSHPTAIKHVAKLLPGYAFRSEDFVPPPEGRRLLRGVNVGVGRLDWAEPVGWSGSDDVERYRVRRGDVVLGMDRPIISGGIRVAEVQPEDEGALLVQRVLRIRGRQLPSRYLAYALATRAFRAHIEPNFTGVSVPHLSEGQVGDFRVGVPAHEDAMRCVVTLDDRTSEIDAAIAEAREAIALSRERRAALITAAVTGQISVSNRQWVLA